MGVRLWKTAHRQYAGKVSARAQLVLDVIAMRVHDAHCRPQYWGGHEYLAEMVLGCDETRPVTTSDARAIKRAIAELVKAGALVVDEHSAPGRHARYGLTVRAATGDTDVPHSSATGDTDVPRTGDTDVPLRSNYPGATTTSGPFGSPNASRSATSAEPMVGEVVEFRPRPAWAVR